MLANKAVKTLKTVTVWISLPFEALSQTNPFVYPTFCTHVGKNHLFAVSFAKRWKLQKQWAMQRITLLSRRRELLLPRKSYLCPEPAWDLLVEVNYILNFVGHGQYAFNIVGGVTGLVTQHLTPAPLMWPFLSLLKYSWPSRTSSTAALCEG